MQNETVKQDINAQRAKELLFEKQPIECSKTEYHRDVRDGILDYQLRMKDLGRTDIEEFCKEEVKRLDEIHGLPPQ